jgi:E3 ubiquitin-protein ligase XBAT32/33
MGHGASCGRPSEEVDFFGAAQSGDLARLAAAVSSRPSLLRRTTLFDRLSALHIAAAHGHLQVRSKATTEAATLCCRVFFRFQSIAARVSAVR